MADILDNAARARDALLEVARLSDDPAQRAQAVDLADAIDEWIATQAASRFGGEDLEAADRVARTVGSMSDALDSSRFVDVIGHGMALVGSLPGDPQSGQKPPRRP